MKDTDWWMCSECEYVFNTESLPPTCPRCQKKCSFVNVACYIPECGGPNNVDYRLVAAKVAEAKKSSQ